MMAEHLKAKSIFILKHIHAETVVVQSPQKNVKRCSFEEHVICLCKHLKLNDSCIHSDISMSTYPF